MDIEWVDGFEIRVKVDHGAVVITANREGMLSLAKQLTALAEAAPGQHIHFDEFNSRRRVRFKCQGTFNRSLAIYRR